jgi:hypothetical protein
MLIWEGPGRARLIRHLRYGQRCGERDGAAPAETDDFVGSGVDLRARSTHG